MTPDLLADLGRAYLAALDARREESAVQCLDEVDATGCPWSATYIGGTMPCRFAYPECPDEWCDGCRRRSDLGEARKAAAKELRRARERARRAR